MAFCFGSGLRGLGYVPSLRASPRILRLPGTDVPGYSLSRPRSTGSGQALRD
jgi:hypothetical protein